MSSTEKKETLSMPEFTIRFLIALLPFNFLQ